jgi:acetoin utilization protein AcuB
MTVKDAMTKSPITIDPDAPLATAVATMTDRRIRHLPVVDDQGQLVGMITDRDLRNAAFSPALAEYLSRSAQRRLRGVTEAFEEMRVRDAMTWGVVTTRPEAPLAQAAAIMVEGRFGSLPVVEGGKLVGLVTERDVLKALAATLPAVRGLDPDTYFW